MALAVCASNPLSQQLGDTFVAESLRQVQRRLVLFGGGIDIGAGIEDGLDNVFVPAFDCDVEGREAAVQAKFAVRVLA